MGILSAIAKTATKVVKRVTGSTARKTISDVKRTVKAAPDFIFGDQAGTVVKAMKKTNGSIFTKVKEGAKAAVRETERVTAKQGGNFLTRTVKNTVKLVTDMPKHFKAGMRIAGIKAAKLGKKAGILTKAKAGLGAIGKGLLKKMPLIGSIATIGFELPNIIDAYKEEGLWSAIKETGKATVRLGGMAVGAVLGTYVGGPVGMIAGAIGGEVLAGKLVGASYSDKKEFLAENGIDDAQIKELKEQGYSFDQIYDLMKKQTECAQIDNEVAEKQQAQAEEEQQQTQEEAVQQEEQVAETQGQSQTAEEQVVDDGQQTQTEEVQEQPVQEVPEQELAEDVQTTYSEEGVAILKELGLSDSDIETLAKSGMSIEDAVKLVVNVKTQGGSISQAVSSDETEDGETVEDAATAQVQEQDTEGLEPFQLPYQFPAEACNTGYVNPYNYGLYGTQLSGNTKPAYYSNPFGSSGNYDDLYKINGKLGYNA